MKKEDKKDKTENKSATREFVQQFFKLIRYIVKIETLSWTGKLNLIIVISFSLCALFYAMRGIVINIDVFLIIYTFALSIFLAEIPYKSRK